MKRIELTQGKYALVDECDYKRLLVNKWHYDGRYASRKSGNKVYMHRLVVGAEFGDIVDHINMNKLDNRRSNLRLVNKAQNNLNAGLISTNRSGYRGVCWDKSRGKWTVGIYVDNKRKYIGRFDDVLDASKAYESVRRAVI